MNNPEVGKIIYILDSNSHALMPHQIVEKVITKTLHSENVHHIISNPTGKNYKLEVCNNVWFYNFDEAKIHLLEAAAKFVEATAQKAKQIEKVFESPKDSRVTSEVSIDEYSQSSHKHSSEALEELE